MTSATEKGHEIWYTILRWIFRKWEEEGMDWIELAQERDRWWALVNVVMSLWVP